MIQHLDTLLTLYVEDFQEGYTYREISTPTKKIESVATTLECMATEAHKTLGEKIVAEAGKRVKTFRDTVGSVVDNPNSHVSTTATFDDSFRELARKAGLMPINPALNSSFDSLIPKVRKWAEDRDLIHIENTGKQFMKINEELGELASALLKKQRKKAKDGLGDTFVTLLITAFQNDLDPTECLQIAYDEIKGRTGTTKNGTFIKDEDCVAGRATALGIPNPSEAIYRNCKGNA